MLSPHEFTTLLLVSDAPDQIDPHRDELRELLKRRLVAVELLASGHQCASVTAHGKSLLQAVRRHEPRGFSQ
jgi:hypothetical protein